MVLPISACVAHVCGRVLWSSVCVSGNSYKESEWFLSWVLPRAFITPSRLSSVEGSLEPGLAGAVVSDPVPQF